ncbi:hypothetical protein ACIBL3_05735 [Kribbella sp. NPDC050124]|uniref:hypothetical protein n=1 Tax=Kribbella sp. NPDC050124 TaxID=3364114 RepID=UPI0037AA348D
MAGPAGTRDPVAGRQRRTQLGGYLAIAVIGLALVLPLLIGELLVRQVVGSALDAPWVPFGADAEGKTQLSILVVLFVGVPLLLGALVISRAVGRRITAGSSRALHSVAALVLVLLPFLLYRA